MFVIWHLFCNEKDAYARIPWRAPHFVSTTYIRTALKKKKTSTSLKSKKSCGNSESKLSCWCIYGCNLGHIAWISFGIVGNCFLWCKYAIHQELLWKYCHTYWLFTKCSFFAPNGMETLWNKWGWRGLVKAIAISWNVMVCLMKFLLKLWKVLVTNLYFYKGPSGFNSDLTRPYVLRKHDLMLKMKQKSGFGSRRGGSSAATSI